MADAKTPNRDCFFAIFEPRFAMRGASHGNPTIDQVNEVLDELTKIFAEGKSQGNPRPA